jgi:hypothetical protein
MISGGKRRCLIPAYKPLLMYCASSLSIIANHSFPLFGWFLTMVREHADALQGVWLD